MTHERGSVASLRGRVSTGYSRLDKALQGGFLAGSTVVLNAPTSDEVPILLRAFLKGDRESCLLISRNLSSAQSVAQDVETIKCLVCSDKPISPARNVLPGKGIENLTDLNLQIADAIESVQPKRVALDILSDILLRHKALQTRKWLNEVLERLRSRGITTLAILNPYMHSDEEVHAVLDLFDGNLELLEQSDEGALRKLLRIKWMHGVEVVEKEFILVDLTPLSPTPLQEKAVAVAPFKEPRWLTPLISRTTELSKLKGTFENALANRGSVVALQGEAGVGKTRLLQELSVYAQTKNATVLSGSASGDGIPYSPWIEITRQFVAQAPGELLRRMLGATAPELVKLVPDITAKLGTVPPPRPVGEQQDKLRFYEAVTQFFLAICKESPLLLMFDDLQYVDQPSLDLLEYFVRSTSNQRILTVCSYRTEDVPSNSPLRQTMMKFNKQRLLDTVPVRNLNKEEAIELIKQTFGEQAISPEFADLVYTHTGGNPFFLEEVLRSLVEDGTIFRTEKGWDRKPIQDIVMPESVKTALKSRLTRFDQETINILTMAAVFGAEFNFQVLMEVMQIPQEVLLERIEKALASGLILEDERRLGILKFADNRVRAVLLDELSKLRRTSYHLRIAETMEKHYAKNIESESQIIAIHFAEGGDMQRTVKFSVMAGDRDLAVHAYEQATQEFERALKIVESQEGGDEERAKILERLGAAYDLAGHAHDSVHCYEQALTLFEKLRDFTTCLRISVGLSRSLFRSKPTGAQDAVLMLKGNIKYLKEDPDSFEAADFYSELATRLSGLEEFEEMNAWIEKGLVAGEKSKNFAAVSIALWLKSTFMLETGQIDEGLKILERSYELALQHELYELAGNNLLNLSGSIFVRDLAKARAFALQDIELENRTVRIPRGEAAVNVLLSVLDWLSGDWTTALYEVNKALEIANRLGFTNDYILSGEVFRGLVLLSMGDLEQAEKYLESSSSKERRQIVFVVWFNLILGNLRLEQGREDDAKAHYETCANTFKDRELSDPWPNVETLMHLTSIYAARGRVEEARKAAEWAKRLAQQWRSDALLAMAMQAEASYLLASGDRRRAEEAYLQCLASWEKSGWRYFKAKALAAYSDAITQTNPEESRKRLEEAAEIFRKLGAKRDLQKSESRLQS